MAMILAGGSHYGASLLWVSLFDSPQPSIWLKGKIEAQQNLKNKLLPQFFSEFQQTLQAFWLPKTMCGFRLHLQGFQVVFFTNRH